MKSFLNIKKEKSETNQKMQIDIKYFSLFTIAARVVAEHQTEFRIIKLPEKKRSIFARYQKYGRQQ